MLAFVGGASANRLRDSSSPEHVPVLAACLFWAAVVVSSLATLLAVRQGPSEAPGQFTASFFDWLVHRHPMGPGGYPGVSAAFLAAGAGALFALASVLCRRTAQLADRVTLALLVSVSALGALSVNRLMELALARPPFLTSIVELHRRLRISAAVPDLNAAGALFLLLIPVACDLLWTRSRRLAAALMLPWLFAGLWLTGSRSALVMLPVGLAVLILIRTRDTTRAVSGVSLRVALLASLICVTALVVALHPRAAAYHSAGRAVSIREDLVTTSFRMARAHPLFGVGIGNYQRSSPDFMPVRLTQRLPGAKRAQPGPAGPWRARRCWPRRIRGAACRRTLPCGALAMAWRNTAIARRACRRRGIVPDCGPWHAPAAHSRSRHALLPRAGPDERDGPTRARDQ